MDIVWRAWGALGVVGSCACCLPELQLFPEQVASRDVETARMIPAFEVVLRDPAIAFVSAQLAVDADTSTFAELSNDDELVVRHGDETTRLREDRTFLGAPSYSVEVQGDEPLVGVVDVLFERGSVDTVATATVLLPDPFDVVAPVEGGEVPRTEDLVVVLSRAPSLGEEATISVWGRCIASTDVQATGATTTIPRSALADRPPDDDEAPADGPCRITVSATITRGGVVDDAYARGGTFLAKQRRSVVVEAAE